MSHWLSVAEPLPPPGPAREPAAPPADEAPRGACVLGEDDEPEDDGRVEVR